MQTSTPALNRTQIYLTGVQQKMLATLAQQRGSSSSALIREAIDGYILVHQAQQPASKKVRRMAVAGSWQPNPHSPGVRALRQEERSF